MMISKAIQQIQTNYIPNYQCQIMHNILLFFKLQINMAKFQLIQYKELASMHSIIMKITHSLAAKDTIALARGLYKVLEGGANAQNQRNYSKHTSWHNRNTKIIKPQRQQALQQQQEFRMKQQLYSQIHNQKFYKTQEIQKHIDKEIQKQQKPIQKQKEIQNQKLIQNQKVIYKQQKALLNEQLSKQFKIQPNIISKNTNQNIVSQNNNSQANRTQQQSQILNKIESKVPASRFSRLFQFGKLGVSLAESAVEVYFSKSTGTDQNVLYQKMANKISEQLCKMRGAPLKLAQMLSIQEDKLIPAPIRKAFQKARQSAHVLPLQEVTLMLQKNFGKQWRSIFSQFNQKPFASASIGQVHRGKIGQQQLAIKIQYPGVRKSVSSDINNLSFLMKIPKIFPKGMFIERILKKTKQQLLEQCDYLLQKCLQLSLKNEGHLYRVPQVYEELTTPQIFVSQFLSGISMKKLEQGNYSQQIKNQVGRRIMTITFNQLFQMGIVQSDPNPANYTFNLQKNKLNLFDFGATHIYRQEFLREYYRIINGSVLSNQKQIYQASIITGFLTGEQSEMMKKSHIQAILVTGEPLRYKGIYDFGCQKITQKIYQNIPFMLKNRLKHPPEEVYSLHRKLSGSYLACMRLKAKVDCSKIWENIKFQRLIDGVQRQIKVKQKLQI